MLGKKWGRKWLLKEDKKDMKGALREKLRARAIHDKKKKKKHIPWPTSP